MLYSESLKKRDDFRKVYSEGKSYANRYLILYVLKKHPGSNRLGISVSKKVGNSIVRHRLTRLIRESYRLNEEKTASGYDLVVVGRVSAKGRSFQEIESSLMHLQKLHGILAHKNRCDGE